MDDPGWAIAVGFLLLAGALWVHVQARERRARRKLSLARGLPDAAAVPVLLEALVAAREAPELEETILAELGRRYQTLGIPWDPAPYQRLITQYRQLASLGTGGAAHATLIEGQKLKLRWIEGLPRA